MVFHLGPLVVGIAALVDRTTGDLNYPIFAADKIQIDTYDKDNCPLCREGLPIVKPGSRKIID